MLVDQLIGDDNQQESGIILIGLVNDGWILLDDGCIMVNTGYIRVQNGDILANDG